VADTVRFIVVLQIMLGQVAQAEALQVLLGYMA
jgi:hypothetical protein